MKILHCCLAAFYIDNYSYQENILPRIHKNQGHEVEILASTETYIDNKTLGYINSGSYLNEDDVQVTRIDYVSMIPKKIVRKLRKYKGIRTFLEKFKPDLIFLHDAQFASVIDFKNYKIKYPNVVIVSDCHTDFVNSGRNWFSKHILHKIIYKHYINILEPYVNKFYGTLPIRVDFLKDVYGIPSSKIELLELGADDTLFSLENKKEIRENFRTLHKIPQDNFLIMSGGKIDKRKKIDNLIEAFVNLKKPKTSLVIFGTPSEEMKPILNQYTESNVIFLGWLNREEIYNVLLSSDLAVYPGTHSVLWEQSVGVGLPCVFRRWKGIEHVDLGGNCLMIDIGSVNEVSETITNIVEDEKLYLNLKQTSVQLGIKKFSYSEIARKSINF
jgi:1,2-diacylglycerol 3-alpha-glucosyltransferase